MSTQHALLGLIEPEPRHGYELKRLWDERFAHLRPIRFSQIYASLGRLERDGLIELIGEEPGQGPDRKRYRITRSGTAGLESWLAEPEPPQAPVQSMLFLKTILALDTDRPAAELLETQRAVHTERMRELIERRELAGDVDAALYDYAIFHLEADLRWIDHVTSHIGAIRRGLHR